MSPESLQTYLKILYEHDELHRVGTTVDAELEIAAIIKRISKGRGANKALLFDDVKGSSLPVVVNLFGSLKRVELILGTDSITSLANSLRADLQSICGKSSSQALTRIVAEKAGEIVQENNPEWKARDLTDEGLNAIPVLKSWPCDGGRYLTLGQVFTRTPESSTINCGMYRVQVVDGKTALLRCYPGSGGARHLAAHRH